MENSTSLPHSNTSNNNNNSVYFFQDMTLMGYIRDSILEK